MTWRHELDRCGGAASARQLRAAGARERELTDAVASGELLRPRKGRYVSATAADSVRIAVTAGARLSCVSAARSYGLWGGTDPRTHLMVPPHAGRSRGGDPRIVRHWRRCGDHPEIWRVSFADCLRSVARCADQETAVAVFDTALSSGRVSLYLLQRIVDGEPLRSRSLAELARPGSDSGVESILRQRLAERGHLVEQQVSVPGVGRVDARIDGTLFVEIDGYAFHHDRESFERDRLRDTAMVLQGRRRLRFSARQVIDDTAAVVGTIEELLELTNREENRVA